MRNRNHARRHLKARLYNGLRNGSVELRVFGNSKDGYRLGTLHNGEFLAFSGSFERQKLAVEIGERIYGQKAKALKSASVAAA